ncbi:DUF6415 family natural product biosynthesis protein [Streptomyces natalensis]|uniref:Uncharacterized protein n=1 Tax=Streptomyces natalensis ATCC 27448 TaxID=1240678 RepID=A0A0D7CL65_9ACTN|nr:DUF6415 family natural product biosynthesis protein [Streptomyces natalensis]KIZ16816.1 hypothetical protein SNA_17595 [Streptomyces natalensis ATCC 27448]
MNSRTDRGVTTKPTPDLPIDTDTISDTIREVQALGSGPLDLEAMTALHEMLRGHVALLLPPARSDADSLWRGDTAWYQRAARLDGIIREAEQPLSHEPFAALVHVQLLARDCGWLLERHVGANTITRPCWQQQAQASTPERKN